MGDVVRVPWRMWHQQGEVSLSFPDGWQVRVCPMAGGPPLSDAAVAESVDASIGTPALVELARGRRNCCILVDDLTRPTPAGRILPAVLERLQAGGLRAEDIFFITANGTHRAQTWPDLVKKLGLAICQRHVVLRHDCHQDLVKVGELPGIGDILVNRFFYEADLKLAITGVTPHFMSGFAGGAKIVMPAVCGIETIARTHEHTVEGPPARVGVAEGNAMRRVMSQCARMAGLAWTANAVFNERAELCGLCCGDVDQAFLAAVARAQQVYATDVPYQNDVAVFNAFPKDTEFIQAMAALNIWADRENPSRDIVRPGGTIVVICACSEGLGSHGLIEWGRRQFRRRDLHGSFRRVLAGRNLLMLAPNVSPAAVRLYYPPSARAFGDWESLLGALVQLHPSGARVAVFPTSALQVDRAFVEEHSRAP